jgi:hypothetical protein
MESWGYTTAKPPFGIKRTNHKRKLNSKHLVCDRRGTPTGAIVLGGTDTRLHKTRMAYAQQSSAPGKFELHLEKVYLVEPRTGKKTPVQPEIAHYHKVQIFEEALNNHGPVIFDSGTTATYLSKELQKHFVEVFNSMVPEDVMVLDPEVSIYELIQQQVKQLPTIVLQMKGWLPDSKGELKVPSSKLHLPSRCSWNRLGCQSCWKEHRFDDASL